MIKFKRVNGWTYKTADNKYIVYNGGANEWYSAPVDEKLVEQFGYCSVAVNESQKTYHYSICDAQSFVQDFYYAEGRA
jgi:hypothetical protein